MPGGWLPIRTGAGIGKCNRPHRLPESAAGRSVSVRFRPMSGCLNTPGRGGSCSGGRQGRRRPVIMSARSRMSPERSTSIRYSSRLIFCRASVNRGGSMLRPAGVGRIPPSCGAKDDNSRTAPGNSAAPCA